MILLCDNFQQSCERRPSISQYPIHPVPLTCCGNNIPIIPPPPPPPAILPRHKDWFGLLPWWLWLIFLLFLLLLLTLLCCLLACCLARNRGKVHANKAIAPIQQQPPPIFRQSGSDNTRTPPDQSTNQFDNHNFNNTYKECNHLQFDDHASISLNDQRQFQDRRATASQEYGRRRGNERAYSGQSNNFAHPFYSSPYLDSREHWEEKVEEYNESVIDTTTHYENYPPPNDGEGSSSIRRTRYVPVHRTFEPLLNSGNFNEN
uniref:Uncharacterized protein n=1 Tax=Ditylenchus dipsaci TaxID=166011 RepID=A0A915EJL7_9BILA